ncbi:Arabinose operon regulatory protein [compost metagenome]
MFQPAPQGFLNSFISQLGQAVIKQDLDSIRGILLEVADNARELMLVPEDFARELSFMLRGIELMFSNLKFEEDVFHYLTLSRSLSDSIALVERKLIQMKENRGIQGANVTQEPKLQVIQQYIEQHLADNITSIDMARHLYLNPSYFSRYFKRMTGATFTDYVHQYKMKLATKMLKMSNQNLESMAIGLGYSDRTYFSKVFKKYVGLTPSEFKAKHSARK